MEGLEEARLDVGPGEARVIPLGLSSGVCTSLHSAILNLSPFIVSLMNFKKWSDIVYSYLGHSQSAFGALNNRVWGLPLDSSGIGWE